MPEYLGVIHAKEQTGASLFIDKADKTQRIFAGNIGDVVLKDEVKGAYCVPSDVWQSMKADEKKPKSQKNGKNQDEQTELFKGEQNV